MKNQKGITLVALVITIIILIILAGITLTVLLGENGLIEKAKTGATRYQDEATKEQELLGKIDFDNLGTGENGESLPANTETTEAGTKVQLQPGWSNETVRYIGTSDGKEITSTTKVATVYAVAVGNGESVPVPYGFYYVGGNITTGVVISDDENDSYSKYNLDRSTDEYLNPSNEKKLVGNQFVWIPCTLEQYAKIDFGSGGVKGTNWDPALNSGEDTQIQKYGGFYVGRFEAGTSNISNMNFAKANNNGSTINDYVAGNYNSTNKFEFTATKIDSSKPYVTSKQNEIPWYHTDYKTAFNLAREMYNTNYTASGLITGTMWDQMLRYMSSESNYADMKDSGSWGNYMDVAITAGTLRNESKFASVDSSGNNGAFTDVTSTTSKSSSQIYILTTGAKETYSKKKIYDVAGNLWEWTDEQYTSNNVFRKSFRGGSADNEHAVRPACTRNDGDITGTQILRGFRVALYLK